MMASFSENLFWEIIEALDRSMTLQHFMIIGSWAEYVYSVALGGGTRPGFRTEDIDILIPNIRKPTSKVTLIDELESIGFTYTEDLFGVSRLTMPEGFKLEFLARNLGSTKMTSITIPSMGITVPTLSSVNLLVKYPLALSVHEKAITVPEPSAYIIQKLLINEKRPPHKKQKDLESIEYLLRHLKTYGYEESRLREIFLGLSRRKQQQVSVAAESLLVELSDVFELA